MGWIRGTTGDEVAIDNFGEEKSEFPVIDWKAFSHGVTFGEDHDVFGNELAANCGLGGVN